MTESQFRRVQADAWRGGPAIKSVTQDRQAILRRVNPDLMSAPREWHGLHNIVVAVCDRR